VRTPRQATNTVATIQLTIRTVCCLPCGQSAKAGPRRETGVALRYNRVIESLEAGETVFGCLPLDSEEDIATIARSDYDFLIIEAEHTGFDGHRLRHCLQGMLDRRQLVDDGTLQPPVTPFVRIAANARERNEWQIKQALDAGAYGIVAPHLDSVEAAVAAVRAARYAQLPGAADENPPGLRGWAGSGAPRYWGLSNSDYYDVADLWPLDPKGEVLLMGIVETRAGIEALPEVLRSVPGIGAIWAGAGDLSVSLGYRGEQTVEVEAALQQILDICRSAEVPCGTGANQWRDSEYRIDQGYQIVLSRPELTFDQLRRGRARAARRLP
jgi:4-hydroxy-2-oxoheptanedioate aldolase